MRVDGFEKDVDIVAKMTIGEDGIDIDFTGTSPISSYGINVPLTYTQAYASFGVRCIVGGAVPNNATGRPARNVGVTTVKSLRCPVPRQGTLVM